MLLEENLFGIHDKVETAIERLRAFEPPEGYFVAFSGGKDSQCMVDIWRLKFVKANRIMEP